MPPSRPPSSPGSSDSSGGPANGKEARLHVTAVSARRTLPPPEWLGAREGPRSAASLALERYELGAAVAHRSGPRAELASLSAKLEEAEGDAEQERSAVVALA